MYYLFVLTSMSSARCLTSGSPMRFAHFSLSPSSSLPPPLRMSCRPARIDCLRHLAPVPAAKVRSWGSSPSRRWVRRRARRSWCPSTCSACPTLCTFLVGASPISCRHALTSAPLGLELREAPQRSDFLRFGPGGARGRRTRTRPPHDASKRSIFAEARQYEPFAFAAIVAARFRPRVGCPSQGDGAAAPARGPYSYRECHGAKLEMHQSGSGM